LCSYLQKKTGSQKRPYANPNIIINVHNSPAPFAQTKIQNPKITSETRETSIAETFGKANRETKIPAAVNINGKTRKPIKSLLGDRWLARLRNHSAPAMNIQATNIMLEANSNEGWATDFI